MFKNKIAIDTINEFLYNIGMSIYKELVKFKCEVCGKEVKRYRRSDSKMRFCSTSCGGKSAIKIAIKVDKSGDKNPAWKGGVRHALGYVYILHHNHPNSNDKGYVAEHRLVMEKKLGRYLKTEEKIHHINGIKSDNRIENLQLLNGQKEHMKFHDISYLGHIAFIKSKHKKKCIVCQKEFIALSPHSKFCKKCKSKYGWKIYQRFEEVINGI